MKWHSPPFLLKELKIEVTYKCELACLHCSSDATPSSTIELDIDSCKKIINDAAQLGVKKIAFSGGEPLGWPGINEAVQTASSAGMEVTVYTTGNIVNVDTKLGALKRSGATKVVFSIFGATPEEHERITSRAGSFNSTLAAVNIANSLRYDTQFHFVPFATNYKALRGVVAIAKQNHVKKISILRFVPQGRGQLLKGEELDNYQNVELRSTIKELQKSFDIRLGSPYNFLMLSATPSCCSAIDRLVISPNQKIYPCDAFKQISSAELSGSADYSDLSRDSLKDCWDKSPYLKTIRDYLTTPFAAKCDKCSSLDSCLSGCLAQKIIANNGRIVKCPDPMCLKS